MASKNTPQKILLDKQTASQRSVPWEINNGPKDVIVTLTSIGTTSGGTLKIEESDQPNYLGTWSQIGATINASAFTGGAKQCVHIRMGAGQWIAVSIATDITGGGTVTVTISGM